MYACMYYVCICFCIDACMHVCRHVCIYVYIYVHMYTYIFTYIYVCIHMCIYIIYIDIYVCKTWGWARCLPVGFPQQPSLTSASPHTHTQHKTRHYAATTYAPTSTPAPQLVRPGHNAQMKMCLGVLLSICAHLMHIQRQVWADDKRIK